MSRNRAAALVLLGCLALPLLVVGQDAGSNPITAIQVAEEANETVITITAGRTPTFSVFKLDDPVRLFVDVNQGEVSKVQDSVVVDNGVLDQVGTLQFRSSGVPVGRIIIGLRQDTPYDVRTEGNRIVVRIDAANRRPSGAEAGALAKQVTTVREELKREQALLQQLRDAREKDSALRTREEQSRLEAERLRGEAERLRAQAQAEADAAVARAEKEAKRAEGESKRAEAEAKRAEGLRAQADRAAAEVAAKTTAAERQLQALREETQKAEARRLAADAELRGLAERKTADSATAAKKAEAQRAEAEKQAREAATRVADAEKRLKSLQDETAKVAAQRDALADARKASADRETADAERRLVALRDETAKAEARRAAAERELATLSERKTAESEVASRKVEAQRAEAERQAREAAARTADAERRLASLKDEATAAAAQRDALAEARRLEGERLDVLRKEQQALKAGTAALAERNAADAEAARQAATRRAAEEQAAAQAAKARLAAEQAVKVEQDRLAAVRTAREAEESLQAALRDVAARETEKAAQARAAREREEALREQIAKAQKASENQQVAELEKSLAAEKARTAAEATSREKDLRAAEKAAKDREAQLAAARDRSGTLEKRLADLQADRDAMAARAQTAEEAARVAGKRADEATATVARKEAARRDAEDLGARLKGQREELARLEQQAKSQAAELQTVATRKEAVTADLGAVEARRAEADRAYEDARRKLAEEELRLTRLASQRAEAERSLKDVRGQVVELESRREAELAALRKDLEAAKAQSRGGDTGRSEALAAELASREKEMAALKAGLAGLQAEAEAARAESRSKEETIRELTAEMAKVRGDVGRAQDAAAAREREVEGLRAALAAEKAGRADRAEVARLQKALVEKEQALVGLQDDLAARLARADELARRRADEVDRLSGELERLKAGQTLTDQERAAEVARLKDRLQGREAEMQVLRKAYDDARKAAKTDQGEEARAAALKARVETQQGELKELRAQYQKEAVASKAGLGQRDARIEELERQLASLKTEGAAKESAEVARLKDLVARREAELAAARQRDAEAGKAGGRETAESRRLKTDLEGAQQSLDRARAEMASAKAREKDALDREARAAARIDALVSAQAQADSDLKGAKAEATELARRLNTTEAEVARLQRELDREKSRAVDAPAPAAPVAKAVVRNLDFKSSRTGPQLVLSVDGSPRYEVTQGRNQWVMTLRDTVLPKDLERRMDVTAFESRVTQISAYTAQDGTVKIVADLARPVGQQVDLADGRLAWTFSGVTSDGMMAGQGSAPSEAKTQMTAPARMVARAAAVPAYAPPPMPPASSATPVGASVAAAGPGEGREYLKPAMVPKKKKYKGRRINLTVKDADIHNVLTFLAREGKVNIVTSEDVKGKVTFHLDDVPWDLALDTVMKAKGLDYVIEQGIYRVAPIDQIQKEYEAQVEKQKKQQELKPIVVRLIPINYGDGVELNNRVRAVLSPKGASEVDLRTNTLVIKDTEEYLEAAEDLVRRLDQQTSQILIEARIVEARTTFKEDIGIQWGGKFAMSSAYGNETGLTFPSSVGLQGGAEPADPKGGIGFENPNWAVNLPAAVGQGAGGAIGIALGSIGGAGNLSLRLSAAEENGDVKIISSPRISTLDNRMATISQGVSIPISVVSAAGVNTQFFSADLRLEVTPHVTRDGHINLKLNISKNEPDFGNVAANGNPTIQKKEAKTELLIRDGDTTVIGGIYTRNTGKSYKKIPLLGDIPILGWLFKSRTESDNRSELLIFITPKVVNREVAL